MKDLWKSAVNVCRYGWNGAIVVGLIGAASLAAQTTGYTITTIAGNGTSGFAGDTGPAVASVLANPFALSLDSAGNLYIVDNGNQRIRKVTSGANPTINTVAGNGSIGFAGDGGPAASAEFSAPSGVAVDSSGNFYVADTNNSLIRKISSSGIITTYAGNINSGPGYVDATVATLGQLAFPSAVALDSAGNLYITELGQNLNNRIRKVSASGALTTVANTIGAIGSAGDGGQATAARINNPLGIACR